MRLQSHPLRVAVRLKCSEGCKLPQAAIKIVEPQGAFISWVREEALSPISDFEWLRHGPRLPAGHTEGAEGSRCLHGTHRSPGAEFKKQDEYLGISRWKCSEEWADKAHPVDFRKHGVTEGLLYPRPAATPAQVAVSHREFCWAEDASREVD